MTEEVENSSEVDYDVVVVGAGSGGIFAVHELVAGGFSVLGIEAAKDVGGVWYHNRYPGARVDVESYFYCYVDPKVYSGWKWSERYAAQPEILAYLQYSADQYGVREHYRFSTRVAAAVWDEKSDRYDVTLSTGEMLWARYLVMAAGQLSHARKPPFAGLDSFEGRWVQTSHWPEDHVEVSGKRIGVIGTGSSGVQVVPPLAREAAHLYVFQRTANYSVPAQNAPSNEEILRNIAASTDEVWRELTSDPGGNRNLTGTTSATELSPEECRLRLEAHWAWGGHGMNAVFPDQGRNLETNTLVADFVREKIREKVNDPAIAETLMPTEYPIGSRRLCVDVGYYETFNRDNVTLVDIKKDPIERIVPHGLRTKSGRQYELDLLVFAIGFEAFTGSIDQIDIRNKAGERPTDRWVRGPRTFLGLMTTGFPNLFLLTGPGSPSVLANMIIGNMQHVRYVKDLLVYMRERSYTRVEPQENAEREWGEHIAEQARMLLRLGVENYMVHVNRDDQSRVFIPYAGGLNRYVEHAERVKQGGYAGFCFA